jgi:hypothetical protein
MSEVRAERRRSPNYPASLVVEMADGKGVTRNVSAAGVYIERRERPTMAAPIHFA